MEGDCQLTILAINPGSTSTKVALFNAKKEVWREVIRYTNDDLAGFRDVIDQLPMRLASIQSVLTTQNTDVAAIEAVVGRGGLINPLPSGTYTINQRLMDHLRVGIQGTHASNLGGLIAHNLAEMWGAAAFIVDPVAVDEMIPEARLSGIPQIVRKCQGHALNIRATALRYAAEKETNLQELNLLVVHLGGGISVVPLRAGKIIDVNNANEMGPFSPERSGTLPAGDLLKLIVNSTMTEREMKQMITKKSGLFAYLGTNNLIEVEKMVDQGNQKAILVWEAMAYQISKEIGRMATVLRGQVDQIILTGGLAYSHKLTGRLKEYVSFIAAITVYPGEDELEALAAGAYRVLTGVEQAQEYIY